MLDRRSDAAKVAREILSPNAATTLSALAKLTGLRLLRTKRVLDRFVEVAWVTKMWDEACDTYRYTATDLGRSEMPDLPQSSGLM